MSEPGYLPSCPATSEPSSSGAASSSSPCCPRPVSAARRVRGADDRVRRPGVSLPARHRVVHRRRQGRRQALTSGSTATEVPGWVAGVMKPGFQYAPVCWKPGFMPSRGTHPGGYSWVLDVDGHADESCGCRSRRGRRRPRRGSRVRANRAQFPGLRFPALAHPHQGSLAQ